MTPIFWILAGFGCSATAVPLGSVTEVVRHPEAERFALTAESVQGSVGTAVIAGPGDGQVIWVVPVSDVREPLQAPVNVWLTPSEPYPAGTDPEVWLSRLRDRFDDVSSTRVVAGRVDGSDAPISRAVRDAEARHGLRSAPNAPVLACCD
ncbi:MAG: hypothetical protein R3F61_14735 [Myxococcota bacterium]